MSRRRRRSVTRMLRCGDCGRAAEAAIRVWRLSPRAIDGQRMRALRLKCAGGRERKRAGIKEEGID